ncbi:MAG: glycosyltransferase family 2 protein [Cyclobacteriaceae bacterium]|nr:glycosyltransferase family 2 protein [Cyclobacteriaceae bacterium]
MWVIELIFLLYFLYVVLYTFVCSLAGLFYKSKKGIQQQGNYKKFCVLIPAYKEDAVIIETAKASLNQNYPKEYFDIVVIADTLQQETIETLSRLPINVITVSFESSTKVKALTRALHSLPEAYDYAVILDADNIMEQNFLTKMSAILATGLRAVQGQRKPKNINTTLSFLDGLSEAINNHIYRQGTVALGFSASINGSGVAFDYLLFKNKITTMNSIGGFDRELELLLLKESVKVYYYKEAFVLDEKVSKSKSFQNQRLRWISSQYFYLRKYFTEGFAALFKGDLTFFNSAVLRNIQLPRLINIGLLTTLTLLSIFIAPYLHFSYKLWIALFTINSAAIMMAIPREFWSRRLVTSIFSLPLIFIQMLFLLFRLKGANKKFIHTPHGASAPQQES